VLADAGVLGGATLEPAGLTALSSACARAGASQVPHRHNSPDEISFGRFDTRTLFSCMKDDTVFWRTPNGLPLKNVR
jgi:hypothetical protein